MEFEEVYNDYRDKVYRLCMGYVNDHELAKDLVQDTFVTAWEQLPKFRNDAAISTWIFRIASNNCLRHLEKQKRIPGAGPPEDVADVTDTGIESRVQLLYKCISELTEIDRLIISLELENIKQEEIAQIVGLSEGNIRVKIHRIKEKLTQKFQRHEQR